MADSDPGTHTSRINRRRVLLGGISLAVAGLAGCLDGGDDARSDGDGGNGTSPASEPDGEGATEYANEPSVWAAGSGGELRLDSLRVAGDQIPTRAPVQIEEGEDVEIAFTVPNLDNESGWSTVTAAVGNEMNGTEVHIPPHNQNTSAAYEHQITGVTPGLVPGTYNVTLKSVNDTITVTDAVEVRS